jgi:sugar (pentulose or hexulose) kinase
MIDVIAVFDIGKTNKKILLFDASFQVVSRNATRFDELLDDDDYPCDDIAAIENWILEKIKAIQVEKKYNIKAINFSTHGATLVYLDAEGNRIGAVYNYTKPLTGFGFSSFYEANGGVDAFSRKTASPAYGMLNTGLQMYWLKNAKPYLYQKVKTLLHYPQYLSYLFTKQPTADFTSIGAHTATWDFDQMKYHDWLQKESISLPEPSHGKDAILSAVNGQDIYIGSGAHDSSASIVPLLEKNKDNEFILLSTGTWVLTMNPFSKEILTKEQLNNNCLCFMTPEKQMVKSSMQFLGHVHEEYLRALSRYFNVEIKHHLSIQLDEDTSVAILTKNECFFLKEPIGTDFKANPDSLKQFETYQAAYYQLMFEICEVINRSIELVLDQNNRLETIYISGGFILNPIFIDFIRKLKNEYNVRISDVKNESALGAALLMKNYI